MQEITVKKDIFISYRKKDGEDFAKRLYDDLTEAGYSVFWFPEEKRSSDFPEDLQKGVRECKDFLIILSESCLAKLLRDESVDWVREELLLALPDNPLCKVDCLGICPVCGNNRNSNPCTCADKKTDPRMDIFRTLKIKK